ncbi:O-antigen ligase family protein [Veillonella sp.]|nr:O-antigen ligase family protein [Veillonella sp.]MDU4006189.1 O-antigen ligase family protein [Veillonella sp.]
MTRSSMAFGNLMYGLIILMTLITCWYRRHEISVPQSIRQYGWAYLVMLLCVLPSAFISDDILVTTKYFFNIWVWKVLIIVPILLCIKSSRKLYTILSVFFVYMGIDALSAFVQYLLGYNVGPGGRAGGVIHGSMMGLAMLLTLAFPLALIVAYDKRFPSYVRISAVFSLFGMLLGMWGNQSRGSWLFNGINGVLITLRYCFVNIRYILVLFVTVVGIGYAFTSNQSYMERLESTFNITSDGSNLGRIYVWKADKQMILDHPIIGVGPGLWGKKYAEQYQLKQEMQNLGHSHNNMLQIASESGILGLIGFLGFSIFTIYKSVKNYIMSANPYDLSIIVGFISYLFLFGSVDYTWGNSSGIRMFWIVMGIMLQLRDN